MGDDGNGDNVTIPTIIINEKDGEKLKEVYESGQ